MSGIEPGGEWAVPVRARRVGLASTGLYCPVVLPCIHAASPVKTWEGPGGWAGSRGRERRDSSSPQTVNRPAADNEIMKSNYQWNHQKSSKRLPKYLSNGRTVGPLLPNVSRRLGPRTTFPLSPLAGSLGLLLLITRTAGGRANLRGVGGQVTNCTRAIVPLHLAVIQQPSLALHPQFAIRSNSCVPLCGEGKP